MLYGQHTRRRAMLARHLTLINSIVSFFDTQCNCFRDELVSSMPDLNIRLNYSFLTLSHCKFEHCMSSISSSQSPMHQSNARPHRKLWKATCCAVLVC